MNIPQSSANHPLQPRRLLAAVRRRRALQMRLAGASVEETAHALGVSPGRVTQLVREAMEGLKAEEQADAEVLRAIQKQDLMAAISVVRQSLASNDPGERLAAADRLTRLWGRLSDLEGLDTKGGALVSERVIVVEVRRNEDGDAARNLLWYENRY